MSEADDLSHLIRTIDEFPGFWNGPPSAIPHGLAKRLIMLGYRRTCTIPFDAAERLGFTTPNTEAKT